MLRAIGKESAHEEAAMLQDFYKQGYNFIDYSLIMKQQLPGQRTPEILKYLMQIQIYFIKIDGSSKSIACVGHLRAA